MGLTVKVDMHVHTSCSPDSLIKVDDLLATCDRKGIDCVAVIDHDTAEAALELHRQAPSRIIVGEEIHTTAGEIAGLFLKETIPPGLSPLETIERIKEQGGLVYLPHPFDHMRGSVLDRQTLDEIWEKIDIVETFNSRNAFPWNNWKSENFARKKGILTAVGSDAIQTVTAVPDSYSSALASTASAGAPTRQPASIRSARLSRVGRIAAP